MTSLHRPLIEKRLSAFEVHERRLLLETCLDEQDLHTQEIATNKQAIKDTNVKLERISDRVNLLRREIRTGITLVRAPEPQQALPLEDVPLGDIAEPVVVTTASGQRATLTPLVSPIVREAVASVALDNDANAGTHSLETCEACDRRGTAGSEVQFLAGSWICADGKGCDNDMSTEPDTSLSTPEEEAAINPHDAAAAAYDQGVADTVRANTCSECHQITGHKLDCSQRRRAGVTMPVVIRDDPADIEAGNAADLADLDAPELPGPYAKFEELYPLPNNPASLHLELTRVLPADELPSMAQVAEWHPSSGVFNAVANWARTERAHYESKQRSLRGQPPIAGLTIPVRTAMPEALTETLGGEQRTPSGKKRRTSKPSKRKAAAK